MLKDLSHVGEYAKLNNSGFRLLKKILPGAYTFILEGTKDIPNRLLNGNRKTIGVRVSSNVIVQAILGDLLDPMMSVSLIMNGYEFYNGNDVKTVLSNSIDLIIGATSKLGRLFNSLGVTIVHKPRLSSTLPYSGFFIMSQTSKRFMGFYSHLIGSGEKAHETF